ncbi:hypothetical protein PPERSA_04705 [Pseudocohnilembus persalinus]|uniref:Uncharacterized protein n=1 Tax=Pseudocohnilembus persalinus TaxID=266149 RepID=A0A0V0R4J9_PSEPJ|nr:hypothetical protein PPERSA_04705 [Pseudocohnilembus persalinus]|eukprot:KRX09399.1 hypothetical protein PPERSA_04705 [Pseudocohnilembus persalinus]
MGAVVTCTDSKKKNQGTKLLKKQSDSKRDKKKNQKAKFQKHNQEELIQPINKYKDILQKPVNYQEIIKILEDKISLQDIIKEGIKLPKHDIQIQNLAKLLYQEDYDYQQEDNLQKIKLKLSKLQQLYNKYCLWQEQQSVSNLMSKKLHFYLIYKRTTLQLYKMKEIFDKFNFGKNLSILEKQNKILEFLSLTYEKYFEENKEFQLKPSSMFRISTIFMKQRQLIELSRFKRSYQAV